MYAVSEISLPRERFESISRMDSHDAELEYSTTRGREGQRWIWKRGNAFTRANFSPFLPSSVSLIVSNLSRNGGDTYGRRKERGVKRISCAHSLHHFSNASCFFDPFALESSLDAFFALCRASKAAFRDILLDIRIWRLAGFSPSASDIRGRSIFFSKERFEY